MNILAFVLLSLLANTGLGMDSPCVVSDQSHFRIHVGTSGLFGGFAHEHQIEAQKIEGCAQINSTDLAQSSIKLTFPSAAIRVIDPKESAKDREQVQKTMETQVLRVSEFPQVTFESTKIDNTGSGLRVEGKLSIRDKTQPVVISMTFTHQQDGTYKAIGKFSFKQTSFGIKPVQLAGGTVKVKDELQTEFEILLR